MENRKKISVWGRKGGASEGDGRCMWTKSGEYQRGNRARVDCRDEARFSYFIMDRVIGAAQRFYCIRFWSSSSLPTTTYSPHMLFPPSIPPPPPPPSHSPCPPSTSNSPPSRMSEFVPLM